MVEQHLRHLARAEMVVARTAAGLDMRHKRYSQMRKFSQRSLTDRFRE